MEIYKNLSLEDLPSEEWRFIPNTDELYMISNMGRIKSVESYRVYPNYSRHCKSRIIKQNPNWQGYLSCYVSNRKSEKINVRTHKVVCNVFNPNPNNYPCVNHKNEIKSDNRSENLEHCTYAYNLTYGSRATEKDQPILQYDLFGNFIKEFPSVKYAANEVGVNATAISNVLHGWSLSSGGYMWRLKQENYPLKIEIPKNGNQRIIQCFDLNGNFIAEYLSIASAGRDLSLHTSQISDCCRGKCKKVKNYIFKYKQ